MNATRTPAPSGAGEPCTLEELRFLRALARLLPAGLQQLQPWLHRRTYAPGECLYRQGEAALTLFFLLSGSLALEIEEQAGRPDRLKIILPGAACGAAALSGDAFHGESCLVLEPSSVVVLPQSGFQELQETRPAVAFALLQGVLEETLDDWRKALRTYSGLTDHLTRANIIV
ncbi:MAG TPA: cyclic nucleotide-binding domain-containing protein [bacterium]|nr:cyclic nucleotide-binding domain-containing protein [bacterium]HPR89043.1 cyclic nucleotide-binding domain-containing protein [bacterium]